MREYPESARQVGSQEGGNRGKLWRSVQIHRELVRKVQEEIGPTDGGEDVLSRFLRDRAENAQRETGMVQSFYKVPGEAPQTDPLFPVCAKVPLWRHTDSKTNSLN